MVEKTNSDDTHKSAGNKPKTIACFLASAIDMEDKLSHSVYRDYMAPENWPQKLKPEIFEKIRQYLSVLIEDTMKHRKIILALIQKYGQDKQSK